MTRHLRHTSLLLLLLLACGCMGPAPVEGEADPDEPADWAGSLDDAVFGPGEHEPRARRVESAADLGARAERLVREGQLEAAVPVLEEAVGAARAGERPLYERALADALLALGADESAASLYRALIDGRKAPPSPALHGNLAVAYLRQGDYGRARSEAEAALRIYPQHAEAIKTLGLADLREGKSASAAARLEAALALKPDLPEAEAGLAEIAEAAGDGREALRRYRKLRAGLEDNRATDFHRRWRNLFLPERRDAAAVLDERIRRLEGTAGTAGTARG